MPKPASGYRFRARVRMNSGQEFTVQTTLLDVLRWEKDHGGQGWLTRDLPLDRQLWLIWAAAKRQNDVHGTDKMDADGWMASVEDFELLPDEDESAEDDGREDAALDPTNPAP